MKTYQPLFLWSLFALLVSLIGYFAILNQIEYERYTKVFIGIDKLQELEVLVNEHVLENMNQMNASDSLLFDHYHFFDKNYQFLQEEISLLHLQNQEKAIAILDSVFIVFNAKHQLIDTFDVRIKKLNKALLAMSLESINLSEQIPQEYLQEDVNLLVNQVFIYHVRNELMSKKRVRFYRKELTNYKHLIKNKATKKQVELLLNDTQIILDETPKVDILVKKILALSFISSIQKLTIIYTNDYQKRVQRKQKIKIVLYVLCVALCILVIYFVFQFIESTKKLRELNNSLEEQVEERTFYIEEREKLLNEFLSLLPFGIYIVDKYKQPLYINQNCKKLFPNISEYHHAEHFLSLIEIYDIKTDQIYQNVSTHPIYLVLESKKKTRHFFYIIDENTKKRIYISMLSTPVFENENYKILKHVIIAFENITEQKEQEKALIDAKKLAEEAVIIKKEFLETMSHELRTPLNAVVGISHLLLEQEYLTKQYENLSTLKFSAENLTLIINDILDYSKIEAGKISFEKGIISIDDILQKTYDIFSPQSLKNGTNFLIQKSEDIPLFVIGDPLRLVQIINNLVSNAIKFTHKGEVKIEVLKEKETLKKVILRFNVIDTGIGISINKIENIFESFSQASSATTRKYGGTGLGLTITKQLVELQKGEISLKSDEGKGSVFSFQLPFLKTKTTSVEKLKFIYEPLKLKVLVVEDSQVNQMVVVQFLKQWKNEMICVNDGLEAVEILQKENFDVVLMDIHMPNMDGIEATQEIRKFNKELPIIALTATVSEMKDKIEKVGMNGIVNKPFNPEELYHALKQIVNLK